MTAGFDIGGEVFWGTNGAIEAYVEAMAEQSTLRFGLEDPWTVFFREEREGFYSGKTVFLDGLVTSSESRDRLRGLLDLTTIALHRQDIFTAFGREWVVTTIPALRVRIAAGRSGEG